MNPVIVVFIAATVILVTAVLLYNSIVTLKNMINTAWSDVDVYLKRRADLIPTLTGVLEGYTNHEEKVLVQLSESRASVQIADGLSERQVAEVAVAAALVGAFQVTEGYPELKASEAFLKVQSELIRTEQLLANARQYYNACVRDFNIKLESFPSVLIAKVMNAQPRQSFEVEDIIERITPKVELSP